MFKRQFDNYDKLVLFFLRRDRVNILIWILALLSTTVSVAFAFDGMFQNQAERQAMVATMENPAMTAMVGPIYGADNFTTGAMMTSEMFLFTIIAVAIMNIFMVVRHTRKDEETGRSEMIQSLPAGRLSGLLAMLIVSLMVNTAIALTHGLGLFALGIETIDFQGSMLYGASIGVSGFVMAAFTALFVQLSGNTRGAAALSFAYLGVAYLVRASGDVSNEALARISPLGLILRVKVYVENDWWPVWILLILAVVVFAAAFYMNANRDLGSGLLSARAGRANASPFLQGTTGLAFRLLKTSFIIWAVSMLILGASYGSILGDLESFLSNNEMLKQMISADSDLNITEQFLTMLMSVMAMMATIPAVSFILKLRSEEKRNHIEQLLAKAVSRRRLLCGYLLVSLVGAVVMPFLCFFGLWAAGAYTMEDTLSLSRIMSNGMIYLPAILVMVALTVLLIGKVPHYANAIWIYLGYSFFTVYMGEMLSLPKWMMKLSPFGNIPRIPVEEMNVPIVCIVTVIAVVLTYVGLLCFEQRDLA